MNRLLLIIILALLPGFTAAEAPDLVQRIAEVKEQLALEQQINIELKASLAARDTEVLDLKQKLKQIEEQIDALKKEHDLP